MKLGWMHAQFGITGSKGSYRNQTTRNWRKDLPQTVKCRWIIGEYDIASKQKVNANILKFLQNVNNSSFNSVEETRWFWCVVSERADVQFAFVLNRSFVYSTIHKIHKSENSGLEMEEQPNNVEIQDCRACGGSYDQNNVINLDTMERMTFLICAAMQVNYIILLYKLYFICIVLRLKEAHIMIADRRIKSSGGP